MKTTNSTQKTEKMNKKRTIESGKWLIDYVRHGFRTNY